VTKDFFAGSFGGRTGVTTFLDLYFATIEKTKTKQNQKNTKTKISSKLVPVSTSRLPGNWVLHFDSVSYGLGAKGAGACCHCHVRCAQASIQASSTTRSGRRRGVSEDASD